MPARVASASSTSTPRYPVSAVNNNERAGANWGNGGGWHDATPNVFPDWVQINFNGSKTIDRVVVYTLQDNYSNPIEPTDTLTFALYGITDFTVQGWNGSAWVTLATVSGNNLVKRTVTFTAFTTDRIRINVTNALNRYSRITEIEAWGVAAASLPPTTTTLTSRPIRPPAGSQRHLHRDGRPAATRPAASASPRRRRDQRLRPVALDAGNARTATCSTSSLAVGTHSIVANYGGDAANAASASPPLSQVITARAAAATWRWPAPAPWPRRRAPSAPDYPVSAVNNNERAGVNWGNGGGWNDATPNVFPDWVQINFNGSKTINRVVVYTLQDNYSNPVEPTDTLTFSRYGITDFTVQGWNGRPGSPWPRSPATTWSSAPSPSPRSPPTASASTSPTPSQSYSRITEIEAWGVPRA